MKSTKFGRYIFLLYDYNSNIIHILPLGSNKWTAILAAYDSIHDYLCAKYLKSELQRLDKYVVI